MHLNCFLKSAVPGQKSDWVDFSRAPVLVRSPKGESQGWDEQSATDGARALYTRTYFKRGPAEDDFKKCRWHPKGKEAAQKTFANFSSFEK